MVEVCGTLGLRNQAPNAFAASPSIIRPRTTPVRSRIHADTAGLPVVVPEVEEAPSLGAAVLAAVGAGHFGSIDDGIAAMVRPGRRVEPDPARAARYDEIYRRYAQLYPAPKPLREVLP